jgi:predicted TIM-barrel fold metal-dependent hydrolase
MIDAYCHLDMEQESPIADIERRMATAAVSSALLVETWDGRNRRLLEDFLGGASTDKFSVALCYRRELSPRLNESGLAGVRMSTQDIRRDSDFCREVYQSGKMLVTHAEAGVGPLCRELTLLYDGLPEIRAYVPHLGWPVRDGKADGNWAAAVKDFAAIPSLTIGVSAIAHFSSEPFPHHDVRDFALEMISQFPVSRIAIGSDYPLFEKERYASYISLARDWVTSIHSNWSYRWNTDDSF